MRKITRKFLATVLSLSLLAGFSVSVASFASEIELPDPVVFKSANPSDSVDPSDSVKPSNIYLANNYLPETTFYTGDLEEPFAISKEAKALFSSDDSFSLAKSILQLGNPENKTNRGWIKFGKVLFFVELNDSDCKITNFTPLSFDNEIEVLFFPNYCTKTYIDELGIERPATYIDKNGIKQHVKLPVTNINVFNNKPIDEMFPNLKVIVFPEGMNEFSCNNLYLKEKDIAVLTMNHHGLTLNNGYLPLKLLSDEFVMFHPSVDQGTCLPPKPNFDMSKKMNCTDIAILNFTQNWLRRDVSYYTLYHPYEIADPQSTDMAVYPQSTDDGCDF